MSEPPGAEPPAWGTPNAAPAGPRHPVPGGPEQYLVLVEQTTGSGENLRWSLMTLGVTAQPTRARAQQAAFDVCRQFAPKHPFREQSRSVYRVSPDEYLVVVTGITKTFHFRVTVAERLS